MNCLQDNPSVAQNNTRENPTYIEEAHPVIGAHVHFYNHTDWCWTDDDVAQVVYRLHVDSKKPRLWILGAGIEAYFLKRCVLMFISFAPRDVLAAHAWLVHLNVLICCSSFRYVGWLWCTFFLPGSSLCEGQVKRQRARQNSPGPANSQ